MQQSQNTTSIVSYVCYVNSREKPLDSQSVFSIITVKLWVSVVTVNCVLCPQLEKVLQQGDIGECAEPYMVFKESDAAKV